MSSTLTADTTNTNLATPKSRKTKKKTKKGKNDRPTINGEPKTPNGVQGELEAEEDVEADENISRTPTEPPTPTIQSVTEKSIPKLTNGVGGSSNEHEEASSNLSAEVRSSHSRKQSQSQRPESFQIARPKSPTEAPSSSNQHERLEALTREREALLDEVSQLRKSLEDFQKKHEADVGGMQEELTRTRSERDEKGTQYQNLLGKVSTIRTQLGDRLKADAADLAQARTKIEDLERQNTDVREQNSAREAEVASLVEQGEQQSKELSSLRNRTLLSQQNFGKEREDLIQREAYAKEEFEAAKQAMQEWEILAMEERSTREIVQEKFADIEEQLATHREAHERAASERDSQSSTVDGLQRALQELQDARRKELRELVEHSQAQIESLQKQLQERETAALDTATQLQIVQQDLEKAIPFEKEVKEKNLLIGKLRHEAVILSDHLTKTLRYVKKGKPEDTIDKQIVTNHILRFLELDRADPRKYQILQIIAGMLAWTDEQREQAGLARPGASNPNLRVPISPWHRTPSTPSLDADITFDSGSRKESLAELWSEFLEQEVGEARTPKSPDSSSAAGAGSEASLRLP